MSARIKVEAKTRHYAAVIGGNEVFEVDLAKFFRKVGPTRKVMVVTDSNVCPLWWPTISNVIEKNAGCKTWCHMIKAGEESKNLDEWKKILSELAAAKFTRDDLVVALGGGVVGDLAGFAASTYMRGIDWIQIPTSLLAMVDSSVGGKTGVDLGHLKNIVGSFWQPLEVFVNTKVLDTLPSEWIEDGLGEVLKYGLLGSGFKLSDILGYIKHDKLQWMVEKCIEFKAAAVKADEFDKVGARAFLNLGHTLGHAFEKESQFQISHGIAVILGLLGACKFSWSKGGFKSKELDEVKFTIAKILDAAKLRFLKSLVSSMSSKSIVDALMHDKKRVDNETIEIILPRSPERGPTKRIVKYSEIEEKFVKPALEEIASL